MIAGPKPAFFAKMTLKLWAWGDLGTFPSSSPAKDSCLVKEAARHRGVGLGYF